MKKKNKYLQGILLSTGILITLMTGCSDPSDFRKVRNEALTNLQRGGMIDFDDIRQRHYIISDNPNTGTYSAVIYDPNNTAAYYDIGIAEGGTLNGTGHTVGGTRIQLGDVYTAFPTTLQIQAADIKATLGSDLEFGQIYNITGEVTTEDGTVFTSEGLDYSTNDNGETTITGGNTDSELLATRSPQALRFPLIPVCATKATIADFVGSWKIESQSSSSRITKKIRNNIVNIVAGPDANEFTIQNLWDDGYDFTATFEGTRGFNEDPNIFDTEYDEPFTTTPQLSYNDRNRGLIYTQTSRAYEDQGETYYSNSRMYACDGFLVLRLLHTRASNGSAVTSWRTVLRMRKQ